MKKLLLILMICISIRNLKSQCNNGFSFGSAVAPVACGTTIVVESCNYAGEFATITGVPGGGIFTSISSVGTDFFTIRQGVPNGPVMASGPTPLTWTATVAGNYYVHVNLNAACGTDMVCRITQLKRSSSLIISAPSQTINCGASATLVASGAATYTWNVGAANGSSIVVTPTFNTIYTVTAAVVGTVCPAVKTISVQVASLVITPASNTNNICPGASVIFTATGAPNYTWSNGTTGSITVVNPTITSNYSVIGGNGVSGCNITSNPVFISVINFSTLAVSNPTVKPCLGDTVSFTASGGNTYNWNTGAGTIASPVLTIVPSASIIYTVTGTDINGCTANKTATVTVISYTPATFPASASVCPGGTVSISSASAVAGTYTWSTGALTASTTVTLSANTTVYTVQAYGANGCKGSGHVTVFVHQSPSVTATPDRSIVCLGESCIITAGGANTYFWLSDFTTNPSLIVTPTGTLGNTYSVTGTDANGCKNIAAATLSVVVCTGINKSTEAKSVTEIYPNPNNGNFTIESLTETDVIIVNTLGQIILQKHLIPGKNKIEIKEQTSGVYFVQLKQRGKLVRTEKVVKGD